MKVGRKSCSLDDARVRFKHLSLLQDFQELQKGTEVARNRLRITKDKKLTLEAEVRFLRKRYNFLLKVRAQSHQKKQDTMLPQKLNLLSKKTARAKTIDTKAVTARPPVPKFDSSQKVKFHKKKHTDTDTKPLMRKSSLSFDLNQNITRFNNPESSSRTRVHQLDLNQIANDDDDFQFQPSPDSIRIDASTFIKGFPDETLTDMKLSSACRNVGNPSSSRAGKRKISWQDQVALRV